MRKRTPRASSQETCDDIGTLWTMRRPEHMARCALMSWPGSLEVRVLVDGDILLSERCDRAVEAFMIAEGWKRRMKDTGWQQVVPLQARFAAPSS
jgi:hypothetical protein